MRLQGKTAIVTGASSGIGRAAALRYAQEGAHVVLAARREAELASLASEICASGGSASYLPGNVRDAAYFAQLTELALNDTGRLDIALNNAGTVGPVGMIETIDMADWQMVIETNLTSAFYAARTQIPAMKAQGSGSLIFTSTFVGYTIGLPGWAVYAASKAGLIGLVQVLATELGPLGIRANALLPGGTRTGLMPEGAEDQIAAFHALKRIAEPEEIAAAALFLASDESLFVTGSAMLVDGGNSITKV